MTTTTYTLVSAVAGDADFKVIEFPIPVAVAIARQAGRPVEERVPPSEIRRLAELAQDRRTP